MTSMAMTTVFLFLAVTVLVGVQGRLNPSDSAFTNPLIPTNPYFGKPYPGSTTHIESQPTNLDESSQLWAFTRNTQDVGGFTQPRGGLTNEYNYAAEDNSKPSDDGFFTPEQLARIRAFNEARQAALDRKTVQNYQATATTSSGVQHSQYPKVLPDGTKLLWVRGPENATPEEMARLGAMKENPAGHKSTDVALSGAQRNEVQDDAFTVEYSSSWEDGPWGTQHRPGAEYVDYEQRDASNGALPASHKFNP